LDGQETWLQPLEESIGDRRAAYLYGVKYGPSWKEVIAMRGPMFIRAPWNTFQKNFNQEKKRIKSLQKMGEEKKKKFYKEEEKKRKGGPDKWSCESAGFRIRLFSA
jgi:hypothetical protein